MVSDPKIVQYVEELDLLIIADGEKLYHITGNVIAGMWKAYAEGHGIDYDICEGCERVELETTEPLACESCQHQKTCKDGPISPRYDCLGYKPEEGSMRLIDANAIKLPKGFFEKVDNVPKFYEWLNTLPTIEAEPKGDQVAKQAMNDLLTKIVGNNLRCLSCVFRRDDVCFFAYECVTNDFKLYEPRKR